MSPIAPSAESWREPLVRKLHGVGIEFGPGCHPLPLGPFADQVHYVDAFDRDSFAAAFPEVGAAISGFPRAIDYRLDFDKEAFVERLGAGKYNFVIASHVLEHLVNPIRFLTQVFEILAPSGLLYLAIPDQRQTFDRDRQRTPLGDLVGRYRSGETVLSEARISEFVRQVERPGESFGPDHPEFASLVAMHRRRSLHVNVWILDDILELFAYLASELKVTFELHDGILRTDQFILLLRKTSQANPQDRYAGTLMRLWGELHQREMQTEHAAVMQMLAVMDERLRETQNFVRRLKSWLRKIPGTGWLKRDS